MSAPDISGNSQIRVRSNRPGWIALAISPALESKDGVADCLRPHLAGLSDELIEGLLLAADELVGNAIEHGCHLEPGRCVDLSLVRTARLLIIYVRDDGEGFAVNNIEHAAINNPPEDPLRHTELRDQMGLRPGGFGIMLAKKVADELVYNEQGNTVILLKYL